MHPLAPRTQLLLFPAPHPTIPNHRACLLATPVPPSTLLRLLRTTTATPPAAARSPPRAVSPTTTTVATDDGSTQSDSGANTSGSKWAEFAAQVSGEWDGYGADFTVAGDPLELPANVVPEAFREWGVEVFDWQTQCPTLANPATPCALHYRLVRLLPTVGCEADAATVYTSHQRHASSASAFAYDASVGSYVAAWPKGPATVLEIEHCVVHPEIGDDEVVRRVRVVQTVALASKAPGPVLRGVKVFSEQWYGPFRNGDQLGGCALREAAFAAGERLAKSEVVGKWESTEASAARFSGTGKFAGLEPAEPRRTTARDEAGLGVLTLLPKQLWSSFKVDEEAGEVVCEVGWVLGQGRALTSRCVLSKDGDVKEIAAACESRVSEGT